MLRPPLHISFSFIQPSKKCLMITTSTLYTSNLKTLIPFLAGLTLYALRFIVLSSRPPSLLTTPMQPSVISSRLRARKGEEVKAQNNARVNAICSADAITSREGERRKGLCAGVPYHLLSRVMKSNGVGVLWPQR